MWSWVKWCNGGKGKGLLRRGPSGVAAADEAWPSLSLSLSLIWWFVGVRLWILEFGLLVIGGFLMLVCWHGGGDFVMDFGFWFCYVFWLSDETRILGGWCNYVAQRRWVVWLRSWTVVVVVGSWESKRNKDQREKCEIFLYYFKAKIHFWSLYFGPIYNLIPKLIYLLGQSLIFKNHF